MALNNLLDVLLVQVCCQCLLTVLQHLHVTEAFVAVTTSSTKAGNDNSQQNNNDDDADIIKGLAAGFGFFFGLILLVCLVWCLCCANVCSKNEGPKEKRLRSKVSPSPPHSANVRTRPSATSSA